jgi:hypothetical protein
MARWTGTAIAASASSPLLTVMLACAAEALPPAPLAEVCGAPGPFRLLPLDPEDRPVPEDGIVRVDDRIVIIVGTGELYDSWRGPVPANTTVRAFGPCGEDPVVIGNDIDRVFMVPQWPGVVLGCEVQTRALVRLDPHGVAAPENLATNCDAAWTPAGLVHVERADTASVVLQPYITPSKLEFAAPLVLIDQLPHPSLTYTPPRPLIDGVLALRADGDIVHVGFDGGIRVEASSARYFALSPDDRYLLWQSAASEEPDAEFPEGDIFVRDRVSGAGASLVHAHLPARNNPLFPEPDAAQFTLGETLSGQWLVELPSFTLHKIPPGLQLNRRIADGRWLARSDLFGPYVLRDLENGADTPLTEQDGYPFGTFGESLDLLVTPHNLTYRETRPLVRYPFNGSAPREIAPRVTRGYFSLGDGRLVSPVSINSRWVGDLVVVDPSTQEELQIDDHVVAAVDLEQWHRAFAPDEVVYVVADGERSGVWLAHLR